MSRVRKRTKGGASPAAGDPTGARPAGPAEGAGILVAIAVVVAATLLAYANSLGASFHFDDHTSILRSPAIRDPGSLWPPSGSRWVGIVSFALSYRLSGTQVFGYHLANVAIHLANALLVLAFARLLLGTPALRDAGAGPALRRHLPLAAAILFAVHPVQTQAVTYVVQRFTSLATLFYLSSVVLYLRAREAREARGAWRGAPMLLLVASAASALAAAQTKEIAFTLPFVALGLELTLFPAPRRAWAVLPHFAAVAVIPLRLLRPGQAGAGISGMLSEASRAAAETTAIGRWEYLLTQARVVATYLRLLVAPVGLNLDHDFPLSRSLAEPSVLLSLACLLAVASAGVAALRWGRRRGQAVGVLVFAGVAWFFVTLSVESSLVPITDVIFEHRMYLPMVGAAVAVSAGLLWALDRWFAAVPAGKGVALLLLLTAGPLTGATIARNRIWRDDVSLWTDVVEKSPGKARAHYNLGVALLEAGRLGDAEARLQAALRIEPSYAAAMGTLGRIHEARGRPAEAYQAFVEALRLDPRQILIRNDLGLLLQKVGRLDEAERELREAVRRDPSLSVVRNSLAGVLAARGELGAAEREYREAGRLAPDSPAAQLNLGQLLRSTGRHEEALRAFDLALAADPRLAAAWDGIGGVRMGQGRPAEAVQAFERSLALAPGPLTRVNLGLALQAAGRPEAALSAFRSFLEAPADASPELVAVVRRRVTALGGEGR